MNREDILGLIIVGSIMLACAILFTLFVIDVVSKARESRRVKQREQRAKIEQIMGMLGELRTSQERILKKLDDPPKLVRFE